MLGHPLPSSWQPRPGSPRSGLQFQLQSISGPFAYQSVTRARWRLALDLPPPLFASSAMPRPPGYLPGYLSPAYLYWRTRLIEGTFPADSGATLADELHTLANYGVCMEADLPYTQSPGEAGTPFNDTAAAAFKASGATLVDHADPIFLKEVFAAGQAIVFITPIHESFEQFVGSNGLVPIPAAGEEMLGYHALFSAGFADSTGTLIVRNSWGTGWGDSGYCYMPFQMAFSWSEAWTIPNIS